MQTPDPVIAVPIKEEMGMLMLHALHRSSAKYSKRCIFGQQLYKDCASWTSHLACAGDWQWSLFRYKCTRLLPVLPDLPERPSVQVISPGSTSLSPFLLSFVHFIGRPRQAKPSRRGLVQTLKGMAFRSFRISEAKSSSSGQTHMASHPDHPE